MAAYITNLPEDVLSKILTTVAKSPDGALEIAAVMATCQHFLAATNNKVVQRAVRFQNVQIIGRVQLFQRKNGLLIECAKAGNLSAQYLLAQVILISSSQMVGVNMTKARLNHFRDYTPKYDHGRVRARDDASVASFLVHFTPVPAPAQGSHPDNDPLPWKFHWQFAKLFIQKCTLSDYLKMHIHLFNYVNLFGWHPQKDLGYLIMQGPKYLLPPDRVYVRNRVEAFFERLRAETLDMFEEILPVLCKS